MNVGSFWPTIAPYIVSITVGLWLIIMVRFVGWRIPQILGGALLMAALTVNWPAVPTTLASALTSLVHAFGG